MSKIILLIFLILSTASSALCQCSVSWDQVIDTEAEHNSCILSTDHPHFTRTWYSSGGWNGTEGYMRWLVAYTEAEDDDGMALTFPAIEDTPYISYIMRVGSTWAQHHVGDEWKHTAFKNTGDGTDRPMAFARTLTGCGEPQYGFFYMATDAGGDGMMDEFGETSDWCNSHPNHTYRELVGTAHTQWYFIVVGIEGTRSKMWIWSQDGTLSGFYAQSQDAGSWDVAGWHRAHLLYYVEATTAGDANSYMDISHVAVHQTLPSPPTGFVTGSEEARTAVGVTFSGASFY